MMENSGTGEVGSGRFVITHPVISGDIKEQPFSDTVVTGADIFRVAKMDQDKLYTACRSVRDALVYNRINAKTASNMLILAHHLRDSETQTCILEKCGARIPSNEPDLKYHDQVATVRQAVFAQNDEPIGMDQLFDNTSVVVEGSVEEASIPVQPEYEPADLDEDADNLVCFMTFLSAYTMRLFIKQSQNMEKSWTHMKNRFIGFFRENEPAIREVPAASWVNLKTYLTSCRKYQVTWVRMIALAEDTLDPATDSFGMLRYLGTLVFGYSGMHAYSLLCHLAHATNLEKDYGYLLNAMDCNKTAKACSQIYEIITKYGNPEKPEKSFFKYARMFGPQYFMYLQTKNCPQFVYLVVSILKRFASHSIDQDPANIVGLDSISSTTKTYLKAMAMSISSEIESRESKVRNIHAQNAARAVEHYQEEDRPGAQTLFGPSEPTRHSVSPL